MNPYITIPIALPGKEPDPKIPGDEGAPDKAVPCKILPAQVLAYHEGYAWGTFLYLSTGQAFCSTLTVEEYESAVRKYWEEIAKASVKNARKIQTLQ
jgi:hypothetical protein